jgi:hypothetical protein
LKCHADPALGAVVFEPVHRCALVEDARSDLDAIAFRAECPALLAPAIAELGALSVWIDELPGRDCGSIAGAFVGDQESGEEPMARVELSRDVPVLGRGVAVAEMR